MRRRRHGFGHRDRGARLSAAPDAARRGSGPAEATRLAFLDAARGIAATFVVVQHAGEVLWWRFTVDTHRYFNPGRFGVVVFFLVSGFIIPSSFERLRGSRGGVVRQFWVGRFFRLYPMYWVSLAAILAISVVEHDALTEEFRAHLVLNTLANVTMLQELMGRPHAIGLYYTLTLEMLFYATCTVLFALGWLRASVRNAAVVIGLAAVASCVLPLVADRRAPMAALFYVASMFVGTVAYRWTTGEASRREFGAVVAAVTAVGVVGSWVNYAHFTDAEGAWVSFSFAGAWLPWLFAYGCFFGLLAARARRVPRVLTWLGLISYSLYLVHPLFVAALQDMQPSVLALGVIVAGSLLVAPRTFRWVEVPAQRIGRRVRHRLTSS